MDNNPGPLDVTLVRTFSGNPITIVDASLLGQPVVPAYLLGTAPTKNGTVMCL